MDKIAGLWKAQKAIPFVGSGEGTVFISTDGMARGCGVLHIFGKNHHFHADTIHIVPQGHGIYTATYLGKTVELSLSSSGKLIHIIVNPYKMGIVSSERFNLNIPVELKRAG